MNTLKELWRRHNVIIKLFLFVLLCVLKHPKLALVLAAGDITLELIYDYFLRPKFKEVAKPITKPLKIDLEKIKERNNIILKEIKKDNQALVSEQSQVEEMKKTDCIIGG